MCPVCWHSENWVGRSAKNIHVFDEYLLMQNYDEIIKSGSKCVIINCKPSFIVINM